MSDILSLFPETYEVSRKRFQDNLTVIRQYWPDAEISRHRIAGDEDLTIDWIHSGALDANEKVLVFTTAEHGIEGYVGSAMLQRFIDRYLPRLDSRTTGLLLVHAINPWGMKYHRRVNPNNVDLNRTFLWEPSFDPAFNLDYDALLPIVQPEGQIKNLWASNFNYYAKLAWKILRTSWPAFKETLLLGHYRQPQGLFYGGEGYQEETHVLIELYRGAFNAYDQILHLDMHTGYGPRYQMSLVNSVFETTSSRDFERKFDYPLVVAANPDEFYAIQGDMIDFVYALREHEFQQKKLYATSFEFGTYGDKFRGKFGTPRAMALENQLHWYGTTNDLLAARVKHDFEELFNPAADDWRIKAVADADRAFEGILTAEGFIASDS